MKLILLIRNQKWQVTVNESFVQLNHLGTNQVTLYERVTAKHAVCLVLCLVFSQNIKSKSKLSCFQKKHVKIK